MEEIFKDIIGYEDYQISNKGRVIAKEKKVRYTHAITKKEHFRTTEKKFLKVYLNNRTGYKFIQLYKDKKSKNFNIHRLVAINFLNNHDNLDQVNHIDGNKHNNTVENLEWCSNKYNHEHATKTGLKASKEKIGTSKLTEEKVFYIRELIKIGVTHEKLAEIFNVSRPTISLISNNKTWKLTHKELEINGL